MSRSHGRWLIVGLLTCLFLSGGKAESQEEKKPAAGPRDVLGDPLPSGALLRLGTTRLRHAGVTSLAFTSDGHVVSYGSDQLQVWSAQDGKELRRLTFSILPHTDRYAYLDANMLRPVRVHYLDRGQNVLAEAISPDGKRLSKLDINEVIVFDTSSGKEVCRTQLKYPQGHAQAFSANSKLLAVGDCGDEESVVRLFDADSGKEVSHLKMPKGRTPARLMFAPDGQHLASVELNEVRLWHLASGKRTRLYQGHENVIMALAFAPNSKALATAGMDKTVRVWEMDSDEEVAKLTHADKPFTAVAFAPNASTLAAAASDELGLWAWASATPLRQFVGHEQAVTHLAFSADGKTLVSTCPTGVLRLWDTNTGKEKTAERGLGQAAARVVAERDDHFQIHFEDGSWRRLDARKNKLLNQAPKPSSGLPMGGSDDGRFLFMHNDEGKLFLWDVARAKEAFPVEVDETHGMGPFAFAPNGRYFAISRGMFVEIFVLPDGKEKLRLERTGAVQSLSFSSDCKNLVLVTSQGIQLWELATGRLRLRFPGQHAPSKLVMTSDGQLLAGICSDDVVRLWDGVTGKLLRGLVGHETTVSHLAFSPRDNWLASASFDGQVLLWDVKSGAIKRRFDGHRGAATSLGFSADGRRLISASRDTTVLVWDVTGPDALVPETPLTGALDVAWNDLGQEDPALAHQAMTKLLAQPAKALALAKGRLQPVPAVDPAVIDKLVASLDHQHYLIREQAVRDLRKLEGQALPAIRKAAAAKQSPEVTQRLKALLDRAEFPPTDLPTLRTLRTLELLERIGTPEARQLIDRLAQGAPMARVTRDAQECRSRMKPRLETMP